MCKQYRASKENCSYTNIAIPHPPPPPKKITGQLQSERKWRKFGPDFHFNTGGREEPPEFADISQWQNHHPEER